MAAKFVFALGIALLDFRESTTDAGLIDRFFRSKIISFSAQFTFRCRRSRALLARPWLRPREFLSSAREARFADGDAGATGAFRTTLAAIGFAIVGISFARPLVLDHSATGTGRHRTRFLVLFFFHFHNFDPAEFLDRLSNVISSSSVMADVCADVGPVGRRFSTRRTWRPC